MYTNELIRILKITRPVLTYICRGARIKPKKKIIAGRAHNIYTDEQMKQIEALLLGKR